MGSFSHRLPVKGFSRLDVLNMEKLGMSNPLPVELLVASHLHPNRLAALSSSFPSLPRWTERLSALAVRALNATSLLTAYQADSGLLIQHCGKRSASLQISTSGHPEEQSRSMAAAWAWQWWVKERCGWDYQAC